MQRVDCLAGLGPDLVRQSQRADDPVVDEDVQDDRSLFAPLPGHGQFGGRRLVEQVRTTDRDRAAVDPGPDPDRRRG